MYAGGGGVAWQQPEAQPPNETEEQHARWVASASRPLHVDAEGRVAGQQPEARPSHRDARVAGCALPCTASRDVDRILVLC